MDIKFKKRNLNLYKRLSDNKCVHGSNGPRSNRQARKRPFTDRNGDIRRSYTRFVYDLRILSYTITGIYDRNTITCFMAKYGRIRSVFGMYTIVNDRLRSP